MGAMRTIGVRLRLLVGDYKRDADDATKSTDKLAGSIEKAGKKSKGDLDLIANKMGIVGAGLLGIAGAAVVAAASFDKQMSEVGAVAGATADQMDALRQAAIDAGAATVFSAKDAAQAEAELAKAGIGTSDILGGALAGSLSLASAGSLDLATSAEIAAAAMNTFGLNGSDVGHVADVLAAAANKSSAGVDDLGQGLQQVGLVANQVGLSFEETVAVLAAFADRGLKGSDGATSLKTALQRLAAPTDGAKAALDELGISMYDANGQMVDIVTVAGQMQDSLKDLGPAERNAALQTIFGSDAIRAANVLYSEGAAGIQDYIDAVDDQGAASRMAAQKLDNLSGDVEQLTGSLETLFISSGEGANSGLRVLAQGATELVNTFSALPGPVQTAGVVLAGLTGAALLGTAGVLKLQSGIANVVESLTDLGPAGAKAATGISRVASIAGPASAALAGFAIAQQIVGQTIAKDLEPQLDALAVGLRDWATGGKASGEVAKLFGDDMSKLDGSLRSATSSSKDFELFWEEWSSAGILKAADDSMTKSVQRIDALDQALAGLVRSGDAAAAGQAFALIQQRANELGISVEALRNQFPQYVGALEVAGPAAADQAAAAEQATKANIELAGAFGKAASEANGLQDAFDALNGAELTLRASQREAEAAVDDLTDALIASGGSLDITDEKGRAAAAATDALAESAAKVAQKTYDQTGSVEAANAAFKDYIEQLRGTLINAGIAESAVDELISKIGQMPTYKSTTFAITADASAYWKQYGEILAARYQRWGGVTEHAAGGLLSQASMFSAGPTRYAFAEPQTGGEAFVPKRGKYGRSMSILSAAAGWYNADVVPRGGWYGGNPGGGQQGPIEVHVVVADPRGKVLHEELTSYAVNTGRAPSDLWSDRRR